MVISGALNPPTETESPLSLRSFTSGLREVDPLRPEADVIAWAALCLSKGGVLIYPTETFYGLGADPYQLDVVERIYRLKARNGRKPLPLIAANEAAARRAARIWPEVAERLVRAFWPGPLTLVVAAARQFPPTLHAQTGKIAVRVSSHVVARDLAAVAGGLIISTSANLAGQAPCVHPDQLSLELLQQVDGVLHAGATPGGEPSTFIDVTVDPPHLLRGGAIEWERLQQVLL
jgi:L-threonylcarbamoyladenylate synthase